MNGVANVAWSNQARNRLLGLSADKARFRGVRACLTRYPEFVIRLTDSMVKRGHRSIVSACS